MVEQLEDSAGIHITRGNNMKEEQRKIMSQRATEYNRLNTKREVINMHLVKDADIIEHLKMVDNKSEYIKDLIRQDMIKGTD